MLILLTYTGNYCVLGCRITKGCIRERSSNESTIWVCKSHQFGKILWKTSVYKSKSEIKALWYSVE